VKCCPNEKNAAVEAAINAEMVRGSDTIHWSSSSAFLSAQSHLHEESTDVAINLSACSQQIFAREATISPHFSAKSSLFLSSFPWRIPKTGRRNMLRGQLCCSGLPVAITRRSRV